MNKLQRQVPQLLSVFLSVVLSTLSWPAFSEPIPLRSEIYHLRIQMKWKDCLTLCNQYLSVHPDDLDVVRMKFECAINLNLVDEAEKTLPQLEQHLDAQQLSYLQACLANLKGDVSKAKVLSDKYWSDPTNRNRDSVIWQRTSIYHKLGDYRTVVETLQYGPDQRSLKFFLTKGKEGDLAESAVGLKQILQKAWVEEVLWLLKGFQPNQLPTDVIDTWANAAERTSQSELAASLWKHVLKVDKTLSPDTRLSIVDRLLSDNDFEGALSELNMLERQCDRVAHFWQDRSLALSKLNRLSEAEASLTKGLLIDPKHAEMYYLRSELRWRLNRKADSMDDLNKAIELNPVKREYHETRIFRAKGQPEQLHEIADFDAIIRVAEPSEKTNYLIRKAAYFANMGELRSAVKTLVETLKFAPDDKRVLRLIREYCDELQRNHIKCSDCESIH